MASSRTPSSLPASCTQSTPWISLSTKTGSASLSGSCRMRLTKFRYLRTIDICHDHFGFYLAWGSAVWIPTIYTVQVQYLARYPVKLSTLSATIILLTGLGGYALFRSVNHQKDLFRRTHGQCEIWGKKAEYITCNFKTQDGLNHESLLLCSGKLSEPTQLP